MVFLPSTLTKKNSTQKIAIYYHTLGKHQKKAKREAKMAKMRYTMIPRTQQAAQNDRMMPTVWHFHAQLWKTIRV